MFNPRSSHTKNSKNGENSFFISSGIFPSHLGSFCVVSSFTTFRPNFTSGLLQVILPRPRIGMLSLVTVSPVITAFHSCCLSIHWGNGYKTQHSYPRSRKNHLKKARGEIWPKRSERRNNTKTTKMRGKSPLEININSQIEMIQIKKTSSRNGI